jgi:N-acetylglucosamine-6-phosphate deacetylase
MRVSFPGFFDLQVNGFAGVDFNSPGRSVEEVQVALAALRTTGVTRCLPTIITSTFEHFAACVSPLNASGDEAIAGLHMEGPYISPENGARGAHSRVYVIPASVDDFNRRQEAADGHIRLVTLAPEVSGALSLIDRLVKDNMRVAIGHTTASRAQIRDAIKAGATLSTHLGNGCPQILHRHDNIIWEQLAADDLTATLIADGHHLPDAVLKSMVRAKGLARTILVTDAVAAAAAVPGSYQFGELEIVADESGQVRSLGTSFLAGSALTLNVAVANMVRACELTIEEVLPLATTNPARAMGMEPAGEVVAEWHELHQHLSIETVRTDLDAKTISVATTQI